MPTFRPTRPAALVPAALMLALACTAAHAVPSTANDTEAIYRQERADCLAGRGGQDRSTCLKEAAAARDEARRHRLGGGEAAAQLQANALQRCQRQKPEDRAGCERMVLGDGQRSGSVAEGAVVRELTITTPAAPAGAASR